MIGGIVSVDISTEVNGDGGDRRRLWLLHDCPDGAAVMVDVGGRWWVSEEAVRLLREHEPRLDLRIVASTPAIVTDWVRAVCPEIPETSIERRDRERREHLERTARWAV